MKGTNLEELMRIAAEKGLDIKVSEPAKIELFGNSEELPKPSKHRNILTEIDGLLFHSKKEARRYLDLREQQRAGAITELATQVNFPLCVNRVLICDYVADFTYRDREGNKIVEDVKSEHTRKMDTYRIKKKLMKAVLGIEIVEIL